MSLGAVDVSADVQCHIDPLCNDHFGLQILLVIHFVAGIADPARGMYVHEVTEVDNFHFYLSQQ
jgi:hypothetical protein